MKEIEKRFLESVGFNATTGCWEWLRARTVLKSDGRLDKDYGGFSISGKRIKAHRAAWLLFRGNLPDGKVLDHLCRVKNCVNPDHLEPVTTQQNTWRASIFELLDDEWSCVHPIEGNAYFTAGLMWYLQKDWFGDHQNGPILALRHVARVLGLSVEEAIRRAISTPRCILCLEEMCKEAVDQDLERFKRWDPDWETHAEAARRIRMSHLRKLRALTTPEAAQQKWFDRASSNLSACGQGNNEFAGDSIRR